MKISVVIATIGRPELVPAMLAALGRQTRTPDLAIISAVKEGDVELVDTAFETVVLFGRKGLTRQRNRALDVAESRSDVIIFFDDDFVPADDWIEELEAIFESEPDVACVTGSLLADGINGPGFSLAEAAKLLDRARGKPRVRRLRSYGAPYGCNMAYAVKFGRGVRFDDRLPLYGWQEDLDFGSLLARHGRLVKARQLIGVHMGIKSGRVSGVRLGASQIINNIYLYKKGTMPLGRAMKFAGRNIAANFIGAIRPPAYIDRRGRLKGNFLGIAQVLRGRIDPEYVEQI
ncbi:glycosyltransferase family 2 protein [Rhizorhabdus argentea]|uniref:glycosyltransferase family 2 protein n=1 Tax=Rhizorhabdus argentea TaxID=1387174 RepID=UPI0030ED7B99